MIKEIWRYVGVAVLIFTVYACNDDDNDIVHDIEPGTFQVTVSGDVEAEFEGSAMFSEYEHMETGEQFFILGFSSTTETEMFNMWLARTGMFPGDDTFDIQQLNFEEFEEEEWYFQAEEFVNFSIKQVNQEYEMYFSESGTITLEMTGDNTVTGEFDFSATGFLFEIENGEAKNEEFNEDELEVNFSGSFNAMPGEVPIPEF